LDITVIVPLTGALYQLVTWVNI